VNNASVTIQKSITAAAGNIVTYTIKYKTSNIYSRLSMTASPSGSALVTTTSRQSDGEYTEITLTGSAAPAGTTSIIIGIGTRAINAGDTGSAWFKDASVTISNQSAYVTTWYDQSGNGLNATQTTAGNQPRIVNARVVDVDASGKPTLYFDGSDDVLSNSSVSISNLCNTFIVAKSNAVDNEARIACSLTDETGDTNNFRLLGYNPVTPRLSFCQRANEVQLVTSDTSISGSVIAAAKRSATNYQESYVNGVSKGTNTNVTTTYAASRINIGNTRATSAYPNTGAWNGNISEVIITTPLSDSQRQKLERNQGKYYGINVA
jgi:hypothetical protein